MTGTVKKKAAATVDGRRQRSERSREAIINAMLELVEEGILVPTAQQVSDRAGVGIRSLFRHFSDMESLFTRADEKGREGYLALFAGGDRNGSLQERIAHAVECRAAAYEALKNTILSTQAQLWRYEVLRNNYSGYQRGLRRDLEAWLPELKQLEPGRREAVDAAASFEMWHRLRYHQGLGKKHSIEIVADTLGALMGAA